MTHDERVAGQQCLDDRPLDSPPLAVNQPHLLIPPTSRLGQILLDHRRDLSRTEWVEV